MMMRGKEKRVCVIRKGEPFVKMLDYVNQGSGPESGTCMGRISPIQRKDLLQERYGMVKTV